MAHPKPPDTKEKLLNAAGEVFAEKGFRDATVAEICGRADANIAAVNYHFGGKEALYQQTWRHAFAQSIRTHPQDGGVERNAPPEERLRGRVKALVGRIVDENNRDFVIAQMEFANPTGLLAEVMESAMNPLRQKTRSLMRELLGPDATERQATHCEIFLLSMCFHPPLIQRARRRMKGIESPAVIDDLEMFTSNLITFALAGIAAVRDNARLNWDAGAGSTKAAEKAS